MLHNKKPMQKPRSPNHKGRLRAVAKSYASNSLGLPMRFLRIASPLGFFLLSGAAAAQQTPAGVQNIENTVNIMVRLCVGGGRVEELIGGGTGGADISLRSLDVKGHVTGEVTVSKSNAEGLVQGIDNALSQIAADEADKVRVCLQPFRERLLDILLPAPTAAAPAAERRLSPETTAKMFAVARQLCSNIKRVPVTAANGNQEAQAYAYDFIKVFKEAGCESDLQLPIPGLTPDVQSIRIGVHNLTNGSAEVGLIGKILAAGEIQYQVNPLKPDFFPNEPFVLVIGAKPPQQIPAPR